MKRHLLIIGCFLLTGLLSFAQRSYMVAGYTFDAVTQQSLPDVQVYLLNEQGITIDSTQTKMGNINGRMRANFLFRELKSGSYKVLCKHSKYLTEEVPFRIEASDKSSIINLDFIHMKRKIKQLSAATVKATRIKMIHRGDTIVYDADAFELAEGSMLDALVKELPGVELKSNGQIFVNGKRVDELLLNGKDFFRNDRLVLLENLPAYMVKNIKVYERDDPYRKTLQKPLAMNVVLKKQYAEGWISNLEIAGGTNERYLDRIFGLRFTDHSRLSLFGNINNINDNRKPGESGEWQPGDVFNGRQRTQKAGLDFYVEDLEDTWNFNTTNEVNHAITHQESLTHHTTFLPDNNVYQKSDNWQKSSNTHWSTENTFILMSGGKNKLVKPVRTEIKAGMTYHTYQNSQISRLAEMTIPFDSLPSSLSLQQIIDATPESYWMAHLLHGSRGAMSAYGYQLHADGVVRNTIRNIRHNTDYIESEINWDYQKQNTVLYQQNNITYSTAPTDYRHQYSRTPYSTNNFGALFRYNYFIGKGWITPELSYQHRYHSNDRSLFQLQQLDYWDKDFSHALTELPSTRDSLLMASDARNSYYSSTYDNEFKFKVNFQGRFAFKGLLINYNVNLPLELVHTKLYYQRGIMDEDVNRNTCFINPNGELNIFGKKNTQYRIRYQQKTTAPSLIYHLDITDDVDPLNIRLNNSDLKNTTSYQGEFQFNKYNLPHQGFLSSYLSYQIVQNALAMGFLYDPQTGVRTTRPDNVNGNWNIYGNTGYNGCIDKKDRLSLSNTLQYGYLHNVDLTGTTAVERSVVHTVNLIDQLSLKYKIGQHNIGLKGYVSWSNISSDRENFTNMNVADFNYGLTALLQLPWKLQFSTDLTMYSRRGYESSSMNTNDLVWNARLSRTFLGGSLTCFVDGFDLLGNLSNVNRTVNAQGRTETRYNVVPRYAMLHVIYRLNKQPKKKNQ